MHRGKVMVSSLGYEYLLHNAWYPGLLPNLCWNLKQTSWYYRIAFSQICSRILILMKAHFQWSCLCYPHKNDHMNTYQFTYINQSLRLYEKLSSVKVKFEMHHFQRCIMIRMFVQKSHNPLQNLLSPWCYLLQWNVVSCEYQLMQALTKVEVCTYYKHPVATLSDFKIRCDVTAFLRWVT